MAQELIQISTNYKDLDKQFASIADGLDSLYARIEKVNGTIIRLGAPDIGFKEIIASSKTLSQTQTDLQKEADQVLALFVKQQKATESKAKADKALADQKRSELKLAQEESNIIGRTTDAITEQTAAIEENKDALEERNGVTVQQPKVNVDIGEVGGLSVIKPTVDFTSIKQLKASLEEAAIYADYLSKKYGKDSTEAKGAAESVDLLRKRLSDVNDLIKNGPKKIVSVNTSDITNEKVLNDERQKSLTLINQNAEAISKSSVVENEYTATLRQNAASLASNNTELEKIRISEQELLNSISVSGKATTEQAQQLEGLRSKQTSLIQTNEQLSSSLKMQVASYSSNDASIIGLNKNITSLVANTERLSAVNSQSTGANSKVISENEYVDSVKKSTTALTENNELIIKNRELQSTTSSAAEYKDLQAQEQKLLQSNSQLTTSLSEQISQYKGVDESVIKLNTDISELITKSRQLASDQSKPLTLNSTVNQPVEGKTTGSLVSNSEIESTTKQLTAQKELNSERQKSIDLLAAQSEAISTTSVTETEYTNSIKKNVTTLTENNSEIENNRVAQQELLNTISVTGTITDEQKTRLSALQKEQVSLIETNEAVSNSLKEQVSSYTATDASVTALNQKVTTLLATNEKLASTATTTTVSSNESDSNQSTLSSTKELDAERQKSTQITNEQSTAITNNAKVLTETEANIAAFTELIRANVTIQKENTAQIAANAAETKKINAAIDQQGTATTAQNERLLQLKSSTILLNAQNKTLATSTSQITKEFLSESGSINELRSKVTILTTLYDALSVAEKKSSFGTSIKSKLDLLVPALKNAEAETGRFNRGVGDYAGGIQKYASTAYSFLRQAAILIPGIGISGIISDIATGLVSLIQNIDIFQNKFNGVDNSIKGTDNNADELTKSLNSLGKSAEDIAENAFKKLEDATNQLKQNLGDTPNAVDVAQGALKVLQNQVQDLGKELDKINNTSDFLVDPNAKIGQGALAGAVKKEIDKANDEIVKGQNDVVNQTIAQNETIFNINQKQRQVDLQNEIEQNNKLISSDAQSFSKRQELLEKNYKKEKEITSITQALSFEAAGTDPVRQAEAKSAAYAANIKSQTDFNQKKLDLTNKEIIAENNLTLKNTEAQETIEQNHNDRILSSDKSYFGNKLTALKSNLESQQKLTQASLTNTLSNPTFSLFDKSEAITKSSTDAFKAQQAYFVEVQKINQQITSDTNKNFAFRYQAEKSFYEASISLITTDERKGVLTVEESFNLKRESFARYISDIKNLQKEESAALSQTQEINPNDYYTKQITSLESYHKRGLIDEQHYQTELNRIQNEQFSLKSTDEQQDILLQRRKQFNDNYTKIVNDATKAQSDIIDTASSKEAAQAKEDYDNNLITLAEFEDKKADIVNKYQKQQLQNQIQNNIALQTNAKIDVNGNDFSGYTKSIEEAVKAIADLGNTSKETKDFSDQLAKGVKNQIDSYTKLADGVDKNSDAYKRYQKIIEELKSLLKSLGVEIKTTPNDIDKISKQFDNLIDTLGSLSEITQSLGSAFTDLAGIDLSNAQVQLEEMGAQEEKNYEQEQDNLQNSTLSAKDKQIALDNLEKQHNANTEENQRKTREYDNKKAEFDKQANVVNIITGTLAAAAKVGFITPIGIAIEIAGLAALIKAEATKIPHYAEGLWSDKPSHVGLYGEAGWEHVSKPNQPGFITNTPTIDFIPTGTRITPITNETVNSIVNRTDYYTTATAKPQEYKITIDYSKMPKQGKTTVKPVVSKRDIRAVSNEIALRQIMNKHKYGN